MMQYGEFSYMARINVAPHAYIFQDAQVGEELKENILAGIFTCSQQNLVLPAI